MEIKLNAKIRVYSNAKISTPFFPTVYTEAETNELFNNVCSSMLSIETKIPSKNI